MDKLFSMVVEGTDVAGGRRLGGREKEGTGFQ